MFSVGREDGKDVEGNGLFDRILGSGMSGGCRLSIRYLGIVLRYRATFFNFLTLQKSRTSEVGQDVECKLF